MAYLEILNAAGSPAQGVQTFDQSAESVRSRIDIKNGVCRALVILWLKAKREGTDFWKSRGSESEGLLDSTKRLARSVDLQGEYSAAFQSRFVQDSATETSLGQSGLRLDYKNIIANVQWGFATRTPIDQPHAIATKVKEGDARFFILGIGGSSGAHSIGIYRDWKIIGPDQIYVFDPNFGEFRTEGIDNTAKMIGCLQSKGYVPLSIDLNKNYILWPYAA